MQQLPPDVDFQADRAASPERMNRAMAHLVARLGALETYRPTIEALINQLTGVGLERVNNALTPIFVEAQAIRAELQKTVDLGLTADQITETAARGFVTDIIRAALADLSGHAANKNNPHGVTAAQVGAYSTAQIDAAIYTKGQTDSAIAAALNNLLNGAPGALDTLNELAAAIGNDANFAATISSALTNRLRVDAVQALTQTQSKQGRANLGLAGPISTKSANYAIGAADYGQYLYCSAALTLTLPAVATVWNGYMIRLLNTSLGTVTLAPAVGEFIEGAATIGVYAKQSCAIVCDGGAWRAIGLDARTLITNTNFTNVSALDFTLPPDYTQFEIGWLFSLQGTQTRIFAMASMDGVNFDAGVDSYRRYWLTPWSSTSNYGSTAIEATVTLRGGADGWGGFGLMKIWPGGANLRFSLKSDGNADEITYRTTVFSLGGVRASPGRAAVMRLVATSAVSGSAQLYGIR